MDGWYLSNPLWQVSIQSFAKRGSYNTFNTCRSSSTVHFCFLDSVRICMPQVFPSCLNVLLIPMLLGGLYRKLEWDLLKNLLVPSLKMLFPPIFSWLGSFLSQCWCAVVEVMELLSPWLCGTVVKVLWSQQWFCAVMNKPENSRIHLLNGPSSKCREIGITDSIKMIFAPNNCCSDVCMWTKT